MKWQLQWIAVFSFLVVGMFAVTSNTMEADASADPLLYTPSLLGHWKLDEASGTVANDSSPVGNHLTVTANTTRVEGYLGASAVQFQNQQTASRNTLLNRTNLNDSQTYTISMWVKPQPTNLNRLTLNLDGVAAICFRNNGTVHIDYSGGNARFIGIVNENRWNHVTVTFANMKLTVYVNGIERGSKVTNLTYTAQGYFAFGGVFSFDNPVVLDDVRLYSSVLNAEQIQQLAAQFKAETVPPSTPTNVKLMGLNDRAANFSWDVATDNIDISGYQLFLNGQPSVFSAETSATIFGLNADAGYSVEVRAKDIAGNLSGPSSPVKFKTDATFDRSKTAIGMNISPVCYYCREPVFIDLAKSARDWTNWNYQNYQFDKDQFGNIRSLEPGREAYTMMGIEQHGNFRKGKYIVRYDGEGVLEFNTGGGSSVLVNQPGYMEVDAQSDGIRFTLKSVNPANYIRNLSVIHADDIVLAQTKTFRPEYIEQWKDYAVTRYMTMMETNYTTIVNWADRTKPQDFSQGPSGKSTYNGVAIEYLVQLSNEFGTDPWFNMPTLANDDYIEQFATYVRDNLDPTAKIYVEYSNETWNTLFTIQYNYCLQEGIKLGYTGTNGEIAAKYTAHRSKEIFAIWEEVFGGDERLVKVIAGFHAGGANYANNILTHENAYQVTDVYATASYFGNAYGGSKAEWVKTATPDEIFADLDLDVDESNKIAKEIVGAVSQLGLETITYEGGIHISPTFYWNPVTQTVINYSADDLLVNKLNWLNRHPKMYELHQRHFDGWKAAGGRLNVTFISIGPCNTTGCWGLFEYYNQKHTPYKYNSVVDWNKNHPIWWKEVSSLTDLPSPPSGLQVSNLTTQSLLLKWSAPTDTQGKTILDYEVFRNGQSLGRTSSLSFQMSGMSPKQKVLLGVKVHYTDNTKSGQTVLTVDLRPDNLAPSVPAGLQSSAVLLDRFTLNWAAANDNISVAGYQVFVNGKRMADTAQTQVVLTGLVPATSYQVTIRSVDSAGNRSASSAVLTVTTTADTAAPNAPSTLYSMNVTPRSIDLHWVPATDNVGVTGYEVFTGQTLLATVNIPRVHLTNLPVSTSYQFTVKAFDAAGNRSPATSIHYRTTPADTTPPTVPQGLRVNKISVNQVTIGWDASSDNLGVANYELYRDGQMVGTSVTTSAVISGLSASTAYSFTVVAVDVRGVKSAQSSTVTATTTANLAAPDIQLVKITGSNTSKIVGLQYKLATAARVSVKVINQQEATVLTVIDNKLFAGGTRSVQFDTSSLADGEYRYVLTGKKVNDETTLSLVGRVVVDRMKPVISAVTTSNSITHEAHLRSTTIGFTLSEPARVNILVLNEAGATVHSIARNMPLLAGVNQVQWNGLNNQLSILPEGLYTIRFQAIDSVNIISDPVTVTLRIDTLAPTISRVTQSTAKLNVKNNNQVSVGFALSEAAQVEVRLYNYDNHYWFTIFNGALNKGVHTINWNGKNLTNNTYVTNARYELRIMATDNNSRKATDAKVYVDTVVDF